jgi:hypothetical protein
VATAVANIDKEERESTRALLLLLLRERGVWYRRFCFGWSCC